MQTMFTLLKQILIGHVLLLSLACSAGKKTTYVPTSRIVYNIPQTNPTVSESNSTQPLPLRTSDEDLSTWLEEHAGDIIIDTLRPNQKRKLRSLLRNDEDALLALIEHHVNLLKILLWDDKKIQTLSDARVTEIIEDEGNYLLSFDDIENFYDENPAITRELIECDDESITSDFAENFRIYQRREQETSDGDDTGDPIARIQAEYIDDGCPDELLRRLRRDSDNEGEDD